MTPVPTTPLRSCFTLNAAREPKDMLQHVPAGIEKKVLDTPYALHDAWKGLNERTGK